MGRADEIVLKLIAVTPMFMAGASPQRPEIRAPAFRGALRYWFRAVLGGVAGPDVSRVRATESAIFGTASDSAGRGNDRGGRVSPLVLKVLPTRFQPTTLSPKPSVTVNKGGRLLKQPAGRDYLYWSMKAPGVPPRPYIPPGTPFDMRLSVWPGAQDEAARALRSAMGALWLLSRLGGVGARSRRAAGNICVVAPESWQGLTFRSSATSVEGAAVELAAGIRTIRGWFEEMWDAKASSLSRTPAFDVLHPESCRIWVLGIWSTWDEAVEAIGANMRDFRTYREPDHRNVIGWANGRPIPTVERAVFGLPLPFWYSSAKLRVVVEGRGKPQERAITRRASPLWLSVWKLDERRYAGVATLFKSAFLPQGELLHDNKRHRTTNPPSSYKLIEEFITGSFRQAKEVHYA